MTTNSNVNFNPACHRNSIRATVIRKYREKLVTKKHLKCIDCGHEWIEPPTPTSPQSLGYSAPRACYKEQSRMV